MPVVRPKCDLDLECGRSSPRSTKLLPRHVRGHDINLQDHSPARASGVHVLLHVDRPCCAPAVRVLAGQPHTMLQPQGAVNHMLQTWELQITDPLPFLHEYRGPVSPSSSSMWVGIPCTIMQITGILQNIPADQYEAAESTTNWWQIFHEDHHAVYHLRAFLRT